jgi:hypothetical protein
MEIQRKSGNKNRHCRIPQADYNDKVRPVTLVGAVQDERFLRALVSTQVKSTAFTLPREGE